MTIAMKSPPRIEIPTRSRKAASRAPIKALDSSDAERPRIGDDAQMMWAFRMGFRFGTPIMFIVAAGMAFLAGTTLVIAAAVGAWSALFSGWYFGGIFFLHRQPKVRITNGLEQAP